MIKNDYTEHEDEIRECQERISAIQKEMDNIRKSYSNKWLEEFKRNGIEYGTKIKVNGKEFYFNTIDWEWGYPHLSLYAVKKDGSMSHQYRREPIYRNGMNIELA